MQRISSNAMTDDMQFWQRLRESNMSSLETRLARQSKLDTLRTDPLAASRAVRFESGLGRLERFEKNAAYAGDLYKVSEDYVGQTLEIVQRVRELAVQGANGVYSTADRQYMGTEVDQLLGELVRIANSKGPDGNFLYGGERYKGEPFRVTSGTAPGAASGTTIGVEYLGGLGGPKAEISESEYIPLYQPGSDVFWAEKQQAISGYDGRNWQARGDGEIMIDGTKIPFKAGDNLYSLVAKINDSGVAVKASVDPMTFGISLAATLPHQMRIEDPAGATKPMSELGLIAANSDVPNNWAPTALVSGGSLFDVVMKLRDSLNAGDSLETGGAALAGIDAGIANLTRRVSEIGSLAERATSVGERLNREIPDTTQLYSREADVDVSQAITDYRTLEYAHKVALGFQGRLFPQTLLDFLK